jgi:hypothetical protein
MLQTAHVTDGISTWAALYALSGWCVLCQALLLSVWPVGESMASAGAGHITNYAQNENGDVWSLQHLAQHMGQSLWQVRCITCSKLRQKWQGF